MLQAKKMDKINPLVAYYCRLHAIEQAARLERSPEVGAFTNEIFPLLEEVRQLLRLSACGV